ncbi:CoA transferase [Enhydrobacter sp.]|jgi:formyl-CoA transferase|uniref:CaiB/BaiF CoA transferase family protein n=1 Tax=Enhydrobacter sp. TaxID=1894999 RepID=UPI0026262456|nr:CoA transferase [Enhydrobacter sp.]WIM11343.1 MAG: L-carnitine dehydratase/bile acid-inducible protein F [Enhydrobacter sp.]
MAESSLPLAGLRVLDISSFIAAPAAAVVLGDWGADVIKIESPDGDPNRTIMNDSSNYPKAGVNYPWQMGSRNKRSLVLDLKKPGARAALDRLIATSDVLICNFPPLVREKLGLTYEAVKAANPRLIYASLTGYGETGPDRDRPGFDATAYFARSGLLDAQRYEGGPPGVPSPAQGDRATAMTLVSSILMALIHRTKTGEGSWVGTSLLGNGLWSCGVIAQAALVGAFLPPRPPPERPRSALTNIYRTSDDRWLQLTIVREDKLWAPLCTALGHPELVNDPRFATQAERRRNSAALAAIMHEAFASRDYAYWLKTLGAQEVTFGVISRPQDVPDDPQAVACGAIVETAIAEMPRTLSNPIRLSFAEQRVAQAAPDLGQHSEEILRAAGLSADEIASLRADGAVR